MAVDPFAYVSKDLVPLSESIAVWAAVRLCAFCGVLSVSAHYVLPAQSLLTTEHPTLKVAANYFFDQQSGKRFRPTIVLLMGENPPAGPPTDSLPTSLCSPGNLRSCRGEGRCGPYGRVLQANQAGWWVVGVTLVLSGW